MLLKRSTQQLFKLNHLRKFSTTVLDEGEYVYSGSRLDKVYKKIKDEESKSKAIENSFNDFASKYGLLQKGSQPSYAQEFDLSEYEKLADEILEESKAKKPLEVQVLEKSPLSIEVENALKAQEKLRKVLNPSSPILQFTVQEIWQSREIRQLLLNENSQLFSADLASEFKKKYNSNVQERINNAQSWAQSDMKKQQDKLNEAQNHNYEVLGDYAEGEEGIDYVVREGKIGDERLMNMAKFKRDLKAEINAMKIKDFAVGKHYENMLLKEKGELDDLMNIDIEKIIKFYPGSSKGPKPEDDPDTYSEWFMRNQPEQLLYDQNQFQDYRDIGVKWKYVWSKKKLDDESMVVQDMDDVTGYLENDELYLMQNFKGQAEFDITERDQYNAPQGGLPFMRFHTHIQSDELLPLPDHHTLNYSHLHHELERWTLFNSLPNITRYDASMAQLFSKVRSGLIKVPDYINEVNTPSLWTYYETLPSWARNDPVVRNVVMAFEYHKPNVDIRQKEQALNFACSFLRPIDPTLKEVLAEAALANKEQMTIKKGSLLLNELQFYEIDQEWLGSESEDFEADDDAGDLQSIIQQSMNKDDEEQELSPMQAALQVMDQDYRLEDMRRAADEEMNINEYRVEPATNQCMTDFFEFDHPGLDDVQAYVCGETEYGVPPEELPLNYYDNDDGFWDTYIKEKQDRGERAGMVTNRMYFIH